MMFTELYWLSLHNLIYVVRQSQHIVPQRMMIFINDIFPPVNKISYRPAEKVTFEKASMSLSKTEEAFQVCSVCKY